MTKARVVAGVVANQLKEKLSNNLTTSDKYYKTVARLYDITISDFNIPSLLIQRWSKVWTNHDYKQINLSLYENIHKIITRKMQGSCIRWTFEDSYHLINYLLNNKKVTNNGNITR